MAELPAVLMVGPRATGKTTTASRHCTTIIQLDRPDRAAAFKADPDAALRGLEEPVLLDEWQEAPQVLGAVKRAVDMDPRPGRYVLTGSARADLDVQTWPGTGRVVRIALMGMTIAEQVGRPETVTLVERVMKGELLRSAPDTPDLLGYVELAMQSGFPQPALSLSGKTRRRWLSAYVDQLLTRDAIQLAGPRDPARLRKYFEAFALNSAGIVEDKTLFDAAGLNRKTASAYEQLLLNLMVIDHLQPWASSRFRRLIRSPKRYLIDPALMAGILGVDARAVMSDGGLLGRVLDTLVVAQIRAQLAVTDVGPRMYHLRQQGGRHEVDLVLEVSGGKIIGIEVKADSAPGRNSATHLRWMRDVLGERFVQGLVLHTGTGVYALGQRISAVPISTLWS